MERSGKPESTFKITIGGKQALAKISSVAGILRGPCRSRG
jgi:hypothetical protein